jgi:formamidopyrimidine-DNA glycosylase
MPELPEVETIKNTLQPVLQQTIQSVMVYCMKLRYPVFLDAIIGQTIISLSRRGKYLLIQLANGVIVIHFGMTGTLRFYDKNSLPNATKHDHIDIVTATSVLRYRDIRKFGFVVFSPSIAQIPFLATLGVEPLSDSCSTSYLEQHCIKNTGNIKQLLMNNKIIVGIGNIYTNEILFASKIHPLHSTNTLTLSDISSIVFNMKSILTAAIIAGGSSISDFYAADGKLGSFQTNHKVYGKLHSPCVNCRSPISKLVIAQRSSFFCANCQIA